MHGKIQSAKGSYQCKWEKSIQDDNEPGKLFAMTDPRDPRTRPVPFERKDVARVETIVAEDNGERHFENAYFVQCGG